MRIDENTDIAVIMGGPDAERPVSLKTGAAFVEALEARGLRVRALDLSYDALAELVRNPPDVALLAMHGPTGEGGPLQGFLDLLGVPYTGSGVLASALAMDKIQSKRVFASQGVSTPAWAVRGVGDDSLPSEIAFPCVVKPPSDGSSVGVSIVRSVDEYLPALRSAREGTGEALIEAFVDGRELSVGISDGVLMGIVEIAPADGFYDFAAKYERGDTRYLIPAPLEAPVADQIEALAIQAYSALGCRGVARVDVMLAERPWVLEVNTIPGMTAASLVPKLAAAGGLEFGDFVVSLLERAAFDGVGLGRVQ